MKCYRCGYENRDTADFCVQCGTLIANVCPNCGTRNEEFAFYCVKCGTRLDNISEIGRLAGMARLGNEAAIARLYDLTKKHYMAICRQILLQTKTSGDIEDVLQDAYVKIFTGLDKLEDPEKFVSWGSRIVTNTALDFLRKRSPVLMDDEVLGDYSGYEPMYISANYRTTPDQFIDQRETQRLISEMIGELSEEQQLCIYLFYMQDMSVKDIAESIGVSTNTVKSRLKYGRDNIEKKVLRLEKQGTKLYGLAPLPFFLWLYRFSVSRSETSMAVSDSVRNGIFVKMAKTPAGQTAAGGNNAAQKGAYSDTPDHPIKKHALEGGKKIRKTAAAAGKTQATVFGARAVAIGISALLAAGGAGLAIYQITRSAIPSASKVYAAGEKILDEYRELLEMDDEAYFGSENFPNGYPGVVNSAHGATEGIKAWLSYTYFDLNGDHVDELLIRRGADQDGDYKSDPGTNISEYPMLPEEVYYYHDGKMEFLCGVNRETWLSVGEQGVLEAHEINEDGDTGTISFFYMKPYDEEPEKIVYAYEYVNTTDSGSDPETNPIRVNGEIMTSKEFDDLVTSSVNGKEILPVETYEWTLFWSDEGFIQPGEGSGKTPKRTAQAETEAALTEAEPVTEAALTEAEPVTEKSSEVPVPETEPITGNASETPVTETEPVTENASEAPVSETETPGQTSRDLLTGAKEALGYDYIGGQTQNAHYPEQAGLEGTLYEGIVSGEQMDLDGDGEDELIVVTMKPCDNQFSYLFQDRLQDTYVEVSVFEKEGEEWIIAGSTASEDVFASTVVCYPNISVYTSSETGCLYIKEEPRIAIAADSFDPYITQILYDGKKLTSERYNYFYEDQEMVNNYNEMESRIEEGRRIAHIYAEEVFDESGNLTLTGPTFPEYVTICYADEGNVSW